MRIIASSVGFAFTFDDDKERDQFFKTVEDRKGAKGFFFPLSDKTHKAEIDKCKKILAQGLDGIDDLMTISGSRKNLECILRTVQSIENSKPENLDEKDFKTAIETIKIICHK